MGRYLFIQTLFEDPRLFFALSTLVIFSICVHEFFHAYVALKVGDSTAADRGHLTLNPLRQMGVFSLIMLAMVGIAWGQVPVNPSRMRGRYAPALVAAAGPLVNLVLWLIFLGLALAVAHWMPPEHAFAVNILLSAGILNLVLCVLNLLPIPGLDGWAVLNTFFPRLGQVNSESTKIVYFVAILLLLTNARYLFIGAEHASLWVIRGILLLFGKGA